MFFAGTNESYKIEDFFVSSTELLKLVKWMQKPGLIELLLYSSDNQQVLYFCIKYLKLVLMYYCID